MPYPEAMVAPMRNDLVHVGFTELRTVADVDEASQCHQGSKGGSSTERT